MNYFDSDIILNSEALALMTVGKDLENDEIYSDQEGYPGHGILNHIKRK